MLYRYLDIERALKQDEIPFLSSLSQDNYSINYESAVCPSRGDRACYREGETVVLNMLKHCNGDLIVKQDGREITRYDRPVNDIILSSLQAGMYEVMADGQFACSFEVLQTDVTVNKVSDGLVVGFSSSNGLPESVIFCTITGARKLIYLISDEERSIGNILFDPMYGGLYVKVVFRGEYGRVTNSPINLD